MKGREEKAVMAVAEYLCSLRGEHRGRDTQMFLGNMIHTILTDTFKTTVSWKLMAETKDGFIPILSTDHQEKKTPTTEEVESVVDDIISKMKGEI